MKVSGFILSLFLTMTFIGQAQNTPYYAVNIGTFVDAKREDFQQLRTYGLIYAQQIEENLHRVLLGGFDNRAQAESVLRDVRNSGYPGAYLQEKLPAEGRSVAIIQMVTLDTRKPIDWARYHNEPGLYGILRGNQLKLVKGTFSSLAEARNNLSAVRQSGYPDAFPKLINSIYLFEISSFVTGLSAPKEPLFDLDLQEQEQPATSATLPTSYNALDRSANMQARSPQSNPGTAEYTPLPDKKVAARIPDIRPQVKRRSALELQKVLKVNGMYPGSLDGLYGPATRAGYQKILDQNRDLQKYQYLAQDLSLGQVGSSSELQESINRLDRDQKALLALRASTEPLANAYQAYLQFQQTGPSSEVDALMNQAIRKAFAGANMAGMPRFDPQATYAYRDVGQIIKHIYFLHAAPGTDYSAPCWLFDRHPQETAQAQAAFLQGGGSLTPRIQTCGQFTQWPDVRMLLAVARDLNPSAQLDQDAISQAASLRAQYYMAKEPLSADMDKVVRSWEERLWQRMNAWSAEDPLHQRLVTAFKVAYYQSRVLLEDYFMDQGFSEKEAKTLALATQRTLVGPHTERFTRY